MYFTKEKIQKNAKLVRLAMPDSDAEKMIPELENVIEWIKGLDDINVEGIEPLISVCDHNLEKKDDIENLKNSRDEILKNDPSKNPSPEFFSVPKIID